MYKRQGYPDAVMQLGLCYLYGHGTATDEKQAAELFQQAASEGNIRAMNELGLCYEAGRGVEKDIHRAAELYRQAAQSGMAAAQCNLGVLLSLIHSSHGGGAGALRRGQRAG